MPPSRRAPARTPRTVRGVSTSVCVFNIAALLLILLSASEAASTPLATPSKPLVIHRRHECEVDTLWRAAFTDVSSVEALFSPPPTSSSATAAWTRIDTCAGGNATAADGCVSGENVALTAGKLTLLASRASGGARVSAALSGFNVATWNTSARLRVHASFPVQENTTDGTVATVSLSLPHLNVSVALGVASSSNGSAPRLLLASSLSDVSVELSPPCPLVPSKTHVVDLEWTPTRWLRWHWDGHLLYEMKLPLVAPTDSSPASRGSVSVDLSLVPPPSPSSTAAAQSSFHIKKVELQRVTPGQEERLCRPRVRGAEANCRVHERFEPRVGDERGYLSLTQVYEFVRGVPARFPAGLARLETIGASTQNRSLLALCVGACAEPAAPQVLFTGMHHSREPVSMMNLVYTIDVLALDFANGDADATALLLTRQLWFVLVVNPDGYARNEELKVWDAQRAGQRKNAREGCTHNAADAGVDLNRNYDVCFNEDNVGSSTDPCGEDFRGPAPFSEPETQAIKRLVERNASHFSVSLNYHSFGRYFNVPFACKALDTPQGTDLAVFEDWAREMTRYNGFAYGQSWKDDNLYSVNGETSDWLWATHGIFAMSPEVGPAFSTRIDQGFWPAQDDVPALALELHYSNLVAARLAGPMYELRVANVTREPAAEDGEAVAALLEIELQLENKGLRTAGDVEIVLTTSLLSHARDDNTTAIFTTVASVPADELGTVRDANRSAATRVLAIPETTVLHVVVRDALSCQYVRVSVDAATATGSVQQWQAVEMPRCGVCRTLARDADDIKRRGDAPPTPTCAAVADLVDAASLSAAAVVISRHQAVDNSAATETRDAKPTAAAPTPQTAEPTTVEPVATMAAPSPSPSATLDAVTVAPTTAAAETTQPSPATPTAVDEGELAAVADGASTASSSSFASLVPAPVLATLALVAVAAVAVVVRRRRRRDALKSRKSAAAAASTKPRKRKNYVKVVNDEHEAEQRETGGGGDDDDDDENDDGGGVVVVGSGRRGGRRDSSDEDDDAEHGRRRSPNAARPRGPSDDDELV